MAVVWAKQTGSWNTASIWAFWNETTQQIEDYGQIPQINDVVYLNGYNITLPSITINVKEIRSGLNSYTNRNGGKFIITAGSVTINIVADIFISFCTTSFFENSSSTNYLTENIIGDIFVDTTNTGAVLGGTTSYYRHAFNLTGNLTIQSGFFMRCNANSYGAIFHINGNLTSSSSSQLIQGTLGTSGTSPEFLVNGNVDIASSFFMDNTSIVTCTINGTFTARAYQQPKQYTCNHLRYTDKLPFVLRYFYIDDTFDCICIDEPNNNPYLVVNRTSFNQTYPAENKVISGTIYGSQNEFVGNFAVDYPPESVVLQGYEYDNGNMTGNMSASAQVGCVTKEDVREGVPLLGMGEVGTCAVPSPDDVREGVPVDDTIGTLIVQGGGDRLRIADFGYYTNAQSDTYIVDLTEQDKPKFAVAEERVLIEMFPDLDLDNIPDKYFDDLFVKYLKYRLIVEYYRTAGINSTFTPSEPTTEIVNYQNVRNEVWLNSANIYLKAWGKKYPESIMKPQRILL